MGKNKLARWNELGSFENVIQPSLEDLKTPEFQNGTIIRSSSGNLLVRDHPVKGKWNKEIFKNDNPIVLELGCGKGEYTIGLATRFPHKNYVGVDIKGARMWRGAKTAHDRKIQNAAFLRTRIEFINSFFTTDEADEIWITFPDPHAGTRNSNKRLTSPLYLNSYRLFLKDRGIIHLKTDNVELYTFTKKLVDTNRLETIISTDNLYSGEFTNEILSIRTHYEQIFLTAGLKINYIAFRLDKAKLVKDETFS